MISLFLALCLATNGQVVPLVKGQAAPFDGQLLDPNVAIDLVQLGDVVTARAAIDIKRAKADADVEKKRADNLDLLLQNRPKELVDCGNALNICHRVANAQQSAWKSPWIWFSIGLAGGVLAGTLIGAQSYHD